LPHSSRPGSPRSMSPHRSIMPFPAPSYRYSSPPIGSSVVQITPSKFTPLRLMYIRQTLNDPAISNSDILGPITWIALSLHLGTAWSAVSDFEYSVPNDVTMIRVLFV
jgi:hypothetical protein